MNDHQSSFWMSQLDKLFTALFNKVVISIIFIALVFGFTKTEIINLVVVTLQECGFK